MYRYRTADRPLGTQGVHTYPVGSDNGKCRDCESGICEQIVERQFGWTDEVVTHGQRVLH